ncbi:DNA-binding transcriptional regulator, MerR family [Syntrophus gentianae]|uniref:DNA-binding transcriptional regulator, MerR family n=1 Tax=Syntrophus gentianae TaxID=43775 RepID=A0A1H7YV60_9BACT|nr:MerR family transcriptional regulator [Syntrophus gentianae]SEM49268.1 DNA-binding transcriptional regulator, MerR family [Syntrophus gentianae]
MYRIRELGGLFGLSRSTLLYYDRIGLLSPSARSARGYRLYSDADRERLASICAFREAGLSIDDIRKIFASRRDDTTEVLLRRLHALGEEIRTLQAKRRILAGMLKFRASGKDPASVDKDLFVEMLRAAGMDDTAMHRFHAAFEKRGPEAHHAFLLSLGIPEKEALLIRKWSADPYADSDHSMRRRKSGADRNNQ